MPITSETSLKPPPPQIRGQRPPLPSLTVATLQEYLSVVASTVYQGSISVEVADRLISCARCLVLAANGGQDEPHTAQP